MKEWKKRIEELVNAINTVSKCKTSINDNPIYFNMNFLDKIYPNEQYPRLEAIFKQCYNEKMETMYWFSFFKPKKFKNYYGKYEYELDFYDAVYISENNEKELNKAFDKMIKCITHIDLFLKKAMIKDKLNDVEKDFKDA